MSTYLDICKDVHRLSQVQGSFSSVSEAGINGEIAAIVASTWKDIQNYRSNWEFMRKTLSFNAGTGVGDYPLGALFPLVDDFERWLLENPQTDFLITDSGKKYPLRYLEYDAFIASTMNSDTAAQRPDCWTFHPATLALSLFPLPDRMYSASAEYYRSPQTLSANTDTPHIRPGWHDTITYGAISTFAINKGLTGLYAVYSVRYSTRMGELLRAYCPGATAVIRPIA